MLHTTKLGFFLVGDQLATVFHPQLDRRKNHIVTIELPYLRYDPSLEDDLVVRGRNALTPWPTSTLKPPYNDNIEKQFVS